MAVKPPKPPDSLKELEEEDDENSPLLTEQIRRAHEDRNRDRRKLTKRLERRVIGPDSEEGNPDLTPARIVRSEGAFFIALLESGMEATCKTYKGTRSGNPDSTLVAVGDNVKLENIEDAVAIIEEVAPRKTKLARRAAGRSYAFEQVVVANIDTLVIVASIIEPPLRSGIIDRYIVAALDGGLDILIAINKVDLATEEEQEEIEYYADVYGELGYEVFSVSSVSGLGIEELREALAGQTSVFAGHSGVGKSSIINAIFGKEVGRTGVLSKKYKRGAHTTTSSVVIPIEEMPDTYLVDTPGVREFSNYELDPQNLKFSFVEFLPFQEHCKITNCTHVHEPGCAVLQAVEDDKISIERYTSYTKLLEEATTAERRRIDKQ